MYIGVFIKVKNVKYYFAVRMALTCSNFVPVFISVINCGMGVVHDIQ